MIRHLLIAGVLLTVAAIGCGGPSAPSGADAEARAILRIVGREYGQFLIDHNGAAPADEAEFRAFLEKRLPNFAAYNVKSVDQLLKSPRDGEPLVIVCGKTAAPADHPDLRWAAYEKTGVDDKRLAGNTRGSVAELDAAAIAAIAAK